MASTSIHPHPPPRALTLSQSLFPPPEPWTPRTFTFNLSRLEILSKGETKPLTWTQTDGQSSLRFSIAARPYKVTLVRTCTGEKDEELLAWTAEDFIAIRLLVEDSPEDSSQSIVTLTIQNRDKLLVDMIFDLRASKDPSAFGYKMENLAHLQDRLKEISIEYRIRHKISMKGAYPIPVPGEDPIIRPKTPPNYKPGDSSTYILYPERPTASKPSTSTANGKGKGKEKEKENGLNGVRKQVGKKGKSKIDKKKGEEENTDESEYKGESDEEKEGKGGKTKSRVVRKKGKEKAVIEIVTNGKGNGSKKLGGKGKKPETQSNGKGGRKGCVTKKVKPGYEIETVTEDDTTEYEEEEEEGSDNRSTTSKKRKGKVEPPVVMSPRGRVRRQSTVAKKVSYVEKGENSFEEDEDSGDTRRGKGDEEDSDSENDRLPSAGKRRRRRSSSSTQPPNRSRPRTMSPDPLPAPVASTSRHFELSPEAAETIDPLKRQLASHETRLDALSSFVYSPNRGGSLAGGVEEGLMGEEFDWLNGDSDLGWEENMKFLKSGYTDMRAKMKVYATEIQQLKVATEAIAVDCGKGKGKEREVDGDVDMDPDSTPQESISILQNRIDALETSYSGLKTLLETSYSNLSETLETLQASTTSAFARIEELGNRNAQLEKEKEESRREEGKKRNEIKLLERRREEERKREAEERQEMKDEMRRLREDVNRLTGQATINPQDVFGTSGPASNLYNAPALTPWQSQVDQSNLGGAAAIHREQPASPFQQPFSLPTLPHDSDTSSPNGSNRSSKRIANAPDTELSRRRRAASVGAPRVQADSTAPRTGSRRSGVGRGRGRVSATPAPKGSSKTSRSTRSKTVDPLALSSDYDESSTSSHKQPSKKLQAIPPRTVRTRLSQPAVPSFESAPPSSIPQQSSSTSERSPTKVSAEEEQIYDQLAGLVDRMTPEEAVLFKLAQGARNELWNMEEEEG